MYGEVKVDGSKLHIFDEAYPEKPPKTIEV